MTIGLYIVYNLIANNFGHRAIIKKFKRVKSRLFDARLYEFILLHVFINTNSTFD